MHQHLRKREKLTILNFMYADLKKRLRGAKMIRVNEEWDKHENAHIVWSSRAYFLQDFKKYAPKTLSVKKSQRAGTFVQKQS